MFAAQLFLLEWTEMQNMISVNDQQSFVLIVPSQADHWASILIGVDKNKELNHKKKRVLTKKNMIEVISGKRWIRFLGKMSSNHCIAEIKFDKILFRYFEPGRGSFRLKIVFTPIQKPKKACQNFWTAVDCQCLFQTRIIAFKRYEWQKLKSIGKNTGNRKRTFKQKYPWSSEIAALNFYLSLTLPTENSTFPGWPNIKVIHCPVYGPYTPYKKNR